MYNKKEKLIDLKETEVIIKVCLKNFDPKKILKDIEKIDEEVRILVAKKKEIVEKRLLVSEENTKKLKNQLKENKLKQSILIDHNGLLKKLAKARKIVKETEKILMEV